MGCWNGTCGVSQLPIIHGETIRLFLLVPTSEGDNPNGMCYSTALFEPGWFPIRAKYNDYGSVEGIENNWNTAFIHAALKGRAETPTDDSLKSLIDQMERGTFHINVPRFHAGTSATAAIVPSLFMVRENIYMGLASVLDPDGWRMPKTEDEWSASLNEAMEILSPPPFTGGTEIEREIETMKQQFRLTSGDLDNPLLTGFVSGFGGMYFDKGYRDLLIKGDDATKRGILRVRMEYLRFCIAMSAMRKTWIAQSGQGSQHTLDITHEVMADLYRSEMDYINRDYEE